MRQSGMTCLNEPRRILAGVTRQLVIEADDSLGHPVSEQDIPVEAFRTAEEAFVSSSRRLVAATADGQRTISDSRLWAHFWPALGQF